MKIVQETYKIKWKIQDWILVQHDKKLVEKQKIKIKADKSSHIKSTWVVGLKMAEGENEEGIKIYWMLSELEDGFNDIAVRITTKFLYGSGTEHSTFVVCCFVNFFSCLFSRA